jgi:hypothetical protein
MGRRNRKEQPLGPFLAACAVVGLLWIAVLVTILYVVRNDALQSALLRMLYAVTPILLLGLILLKTANWRSWRKSPEAGIKDIGQDVIHAALPMLPEEPHRLKSRSRIRLDRQEYKVWRQAAVDHRLVLSEQPRVLLQGVYCDVPVRVDIIDGETLETCAAVNVKLDLPGECRIQVGPDGELVHEGSAPELLAAIRNSPAAAWISALGDVTLIADGKKVKIYAPEIVADPDRMKGLLEAVVTSSRAVAEALEA